MRGHNELTKRLWRRVLFRLCWVFLCICLIALTGCRGKTSNPTDPVLETPTPEPSPEPTATEPPDEERTPTQGNESCDDYGENIDDPDLLVLQTDGEPVEISMDCTGDIDWYIIEISDSLPVRVDIELTKIPERSDFDLSLYDANQTALEDGRSAQSGNVDENISVVVDASPLYLQIYSYRGRGEALVTVTSDPEDEPGDDDGDDDGEEPEEEPEEPIEQLAYEDVLDTEYPSFPRGTDSGLLEHSVETVVVKSLECQLDDDTEVSGELTIGNYAHVERDLLDSIDYIDGWGAVVFNGDRQILDQLSITIRVTLFAPELDLEVSAPSEMEIDGDDYLASDTDDEVYYLAQSYGDLFGNSRDDIQVSSGVVGDLGELFTNNIFTQQIEVEWRIDEPEGGSCSGRASGKAIIDFDLGSFLRFRQDRPAGW